jgi:thioredoxin reductase (NADPH)
LIKNNALEKHWDIIIIGGGPSGINCAIEAGKANLSALILEKGVTVHSLFHFPTNMTFFSTSRLLEIGQIPFVSHNEKPTRQESLEYYRRLIQHFHLNYHPYEAVVDLYPIQKGETNVFFKIQTVKRAYFCKNVIIATGFYDKPVLLNVPGEDLPKVKHYYDDPHCYIHQKVVVIGAANSACDAALEIWQKGGQVTMLIRGSELSPRVKYWIKPNIENRIKEGSITAYFNSEVLEILTDKVVFKSENQIITIENDWVLALTGYHPDVDFLTHLGLEFENKETCKPTFDESTLETHRKGVYIAGVVCGGMETSKLFIENTRDHADKIIRDILKKNKPMVL